MEEQVIFYASEAEKIIKYLNHKKEEGLIITNLELADGLGKAVFEETDKDFIYSLDYSRLYPKTSLFFNEDYEYFDTAKLEGWVLQCYIEGMGIWINENKNAPLFLLEEEYQEICDQEWVVRKKHLKDNNLKYLIIFIGDLFFCLRGGLIGLIYGLPFVLLYSYVLFTTMTKRKNYPEAVIDTYVTIYFISSWLLCWLKFNYALFIEGIFIVCCLDLLRENSFIIKNSFIRALLLACLVILFIVTLLWGK